MEGSIVFYTYGSTLELYGQQFTAGMLTARLRDPVAIVSMIKNMINPWANTVKIRKSDSKKAPLSTLSKVDRGAFSLTYQCRLHRYPLHFPP